MLRSLLSLVYLTALVACGDNGGADAPVDSSVPAIDAGAPDARPTELGGSRPVDVQGPFELVAGRTYPLVLVLHGYDANGLLQAAYLQIAQLRENPGIILMAPDGTKNSDGARFWNASPACCDDGSNVDDLGYLGKLLDDAIATWPVDRSRVFIVGHSNGDFMANRLACERADVVTAIAGLAGAAISLDGANCNPVKPVSVLHIHGTDDRTIKYAGGGTGAKAYPSATATVDQWAKHNKCTGARAEAGTLDLERVLPGPESKREVVAGCPATGAVELWTIEAGSHQPAFTSDFGAQVWAWLDAHARP